MNSWQYRYDTGWVACSDWTDQHLGTALGGNVTHNLNAPLSDLLVRVLISTDGTDANSFEPRDADSNAGSRGWTLYAVDNNTLKVQTGSAGIGFYDDSGNFTTIDTDDWYYKVKVWYLG